MGKRFDALIFDLDDTLWEVGPVIVRAEHALYDFLVRRYPRVTQRHDLGSMRDLRARTALQHPQMRHDFTWLRLESLRMHAEEAGYEATMADEAFDVFFRARNEVELYPDVVPALTTLRSSHRLFALSNGNADLGLIGLGDYFELHATARAAGVMKPDARAFRYVLDGPALLSTALPTSATIRTPTSAARKTAGLTAVWINRGGAAWPAESQRPDHVVASLAELVNWLDT
jgi:putative hydrolase of the HAD superfamily